MASNITKSIPILTLLGAFALVLVEGFFGFDLDYDALVPLLVATGIGGVPLSIAKKAIAARHAIPKSVEVEILKKIKDAQIEKN